MAVLLLALGALSLQGRPAHAYLSDDQQREGEVSLDYQDDGSGELPKHPGPGGPGGNDGTRRADPDDLSFNTPRVDTPVVPVPTTAAARPAWFGLLRVWLQQLFSYLATLR